MKFEPRVFTLAALILLQSLANVHSKRPPWPETPLAGKSQGEVLDNLISTNWNARVMAAVELDDRRQQLVQNLMAILDSTNSARVKVDAIVVLGEYRASEAVPILIQHLEWDEAARAGIYNGLARSEELEEKTMPVSIALEKIGMPSIPALLVKITETDDAITTEKCISICNRIEGREITQFRLQGLLEKESDQKKKERIQSALDILKNLKTEK